MRGSTRFGLENGSEHLAAAGFDDVRVETYEDALAVTEVEPVLAYLRSMVLVPDAGVVDRIARAVAETIARNGSFHVTKSQGIIGAHRPPLL